MNKFLYVVFCFLLFACKDKNPTPLEDTFFNSGELNVNTNIVKTISVQNITNNSATATVELVGSPEQNTVSAELGAIVNTSANNTFINSAGAKVGTATTIFSLATENSSINNLTENTNYYVRAYAKSNTTGKYFYGDAIAFKTLQQNIGNALQITPSTINFGDKNIGSTSSQNIEIKNTTNQNVSIVINGIVAPYLTSPTSFTLTAYQTVNITIYFAPTAIGSYTQQLNLQYGSAIQTITLQGRGVSLPTTTTLIASPTALNFPTTYTGTSNSLNLRLTNTGSIAANFNTSHAAKFSGIPVSGTVPAGSYKDYTISFSPQAAINYSDNLTVSYNGGSLNVPMQGIGATGTRILDIGLTTSTNFGNVAIGSSVTKVLRLSNLGNSLLTITSINPMNGFSCNFSGTLQPTESKLVNVVFTPTVRQTYIATLLVNSNRTSGTYTLSITGKGI
jgi:hypothetical protein